MSSISNFFNKILRIFTQLFLPYQFGYVQPHNYIDCSTVDILEEILININEDDQSSLICHYENTFARYIGRGFASSFASGRMAFYAAMEVLDIKDGDEIILTAFTCSVMSNAVIRRGAKPVYIDVDPNTFGSSASAIEKAITTNTKIIVAQHSFGIPCDIDKISDLARRKNIFLIEDCAISLGSTLHGVAVGNWGDAAIFSTDHSKPINTILGGIIYTRDYDFHLRVRSIADNAPQLDKNHQKNLFNQFKFERIFYQVGNYPRGKLLNQFKNFFRKLRKGGASFLEDNYWGLGSFKKESYPYPAAIPPFLAYLGIIELERCNYQAALRKNILEIYLNEFREAASDLQIPSVYFDKTRQINPLRFVFTANDRNKYLKKISKFFDINWIWFFEPIILAVDGLESVYYRAGSCPISESICKRIVNLPCNVDYGGKNLLIKTLRKIQ